MRTPTTMLTLLSLPLLLVATGCGERTSSTADQATDDAAQSSPGASAWGDCTVDDIGKGGTVVLRADVEGDGDANAFRLYPAGDGPCADGLVVRTGGGVHGIDVADLDLDPKTFRAVALDDEHGKLLVVADSADVRRGGHQPHVFTLDSGNLVEVTRDGAPLLPFVATDGGGQPATATCEPHGELALWTATASQPPGIVLAWDVRKTAYLLVHDKAVEQKSVLVEDATADPTMRKKMPQLFEPDGFFADC